MQTKIEKARKTGRKSTMLIWLCWLVYACSYLGKVNYSANITQIEAYFNVSHADAGMVSTFLFFAYGAGQIFNGFFCRRYNVKYAVFGALVVSAASNLGVALTPDFALVKFFWLLNGAALSVLWPTLIGFLAQTLKKEDMSRASVVMGTTVATGTLAIYGLSSLYATMSAFKLAFYTAAIALPAVGIVWLCFFDKFTKREEGEEDDSLDVPAPVESTQKKEKTKMPKNILAVAIFLGVFAVATNLVCDGLTTWVPSILKETYGLPDSLSILLTLALPMVALFGNVFAVTLYKKTKSFIVNCGVVFLLAGLLLACVIGLMQTELFVVTIVLFAVVRCLGGSANSTITSIFPLYMKGKVNSGMMAGLLNGCCYVGSTISSYGLGVVADNFGWSAVFYLLLGVCALVVVIAFAYKTVCKVMKKKSE